MSGLLLETDVTVEGEGWDLVETISSLLLFWIMEASILMVVDNIDDSLYEIVKMLSIYGVFYT